MAGFLFRLETVDGAPAEPADVCDGGAELVARRRNPGGLARTGRLPLCFASYTRHRRAAGTFAFFPPADRHVTPCAPAALKWTWTNVSADSPRTRPSSAR
jgi:hypothetical protein